MAFLQQHDVSAIIVEDSLMESYRPYFGVLEITPIEVGRVWVYPISHQSGVGTEAR